MKTKLCVAVAVGLVGLALGGPGAESSVTDGATVARTPGDANGQEPIFKKLSDLKWDKILPDLGESSPEICILRVDPKTQATQLLIRTPKAIHVRKHWHTANETHTMITGTATLACDGKRAEIGRASCRERVFGYV